MKFKSLSRLRNKQGFVLVYAMLMIALLMVFMTAIVANVSYTNKATLKKGEGQQLQLSAQSAIGAISAELEDPENIAQLTALATSGAEQEYSLSDAGISDRIFAKLSTDPSRPGFALLTVTAKNGDKEYTLTKYISMKSNLGPKNDLIENMVVAYWPEGASNGLTTGRDFSNIVMDGSVIIDNEYYKDGYGNSNSGSYEYGNADNYKTKFMQNPSNDNTAVKIKGGSFKELVTTGNLYLFDMPVDGVSHNADGSAATTIASAVGQMYINKATIGPKVKEIGAGGYFKNKAADGDEGNKKTGKVVLNDVKFEGGSADVLSRDSVEVNATDIEGSLNNFFIGGKFNLKVRDGESLNVGNDLRGYKDVNITVGKSSQLDVATDIAAGDNVKITGSPDIKGRVHVGDSIVSARQNVTIEKSNEITADSILSGKSATIGNATELNLGTSGADGSPYVLFTGGNYAAGGSDFINSTKDSRGTTNLSGVSLNGKKAVVNNKKGTMPNGSVVELNSAEGLDAFKTMNSLWLSKAQKVTKGGYWGSGDVRFAVSLLLENNPTSGRAPSAYNKADAYNPKVIAATPQERETNYQKNFRWYESKKETYFGGKPMPVSHELMYTTNDSIFMLRNVLRSALGGSSNSLDLISDGDYQGRFIETARTAIPYDGAVKDIEIAYPKVNGGYGASLEDSDIAPVQVSGDTVYIGNTAHNYGKIMLRDGQFLWDGSQEIDLSGKKLCFRVTNPEVVNGAGDFILMDKNGGNNVILKNEIVVEYILNGLDPDDLEKLSCVRFFVRSDDTLTIKEGFKITGINRGSVDAENVDADINGAHYDHIQPEVYFFCMKPSTNNKVSIRYENNVGRTDAFIVAPWSVVDMKVNNRGKDNVVFSGVILCKDLVVADGGTYRHYKPLAFGYAMSDDVFKLPSEDDAE